jgi:hypothetical protein
VNANSVTIKGSWCVVGLIMILVQACGGAHNKAGEEGLGAGKSAGGEGEPIQSSSPGGAAPGEKVRAFDLNHDNKADVWAYYGPMADPQNPQQTKETLLRKEWDFNFDGKVDIRKYFNFKGEVVKDEMDLDFDGKFDVATFYQNGAKVRQEYDFNFDGKPDYWKFFEKNILVRTERDRDFNGRVDRWEYYIDGKLDRVGLDEDGDGQIDKWIQQNEEK